MPEPGGSPQGPWTIYVCPSCGRVERAGVYYVNGKARRRVCRFHRMDTQPELERVEVVPAAQLDQARDVLAEVLELVGDDCDCHPEYGPCVSCTVKKVLPLSSTPGVGEP